MIDHVAGDQRCTGYTKVAPHPIGGNSHASVAPLRSHNCQANGMIDGGQHSNHKQPNTDLHGRCSKAREDRSNADADEEDAHHAVATPFVSKPPCRQRKQTESKEPRGRIG